MALDIETISTLVEAITNIYESDLTELVLKRLDSFGYEAKEEDVFVIGYSVQKVENNIKNDCNIAEIPEGLTNTAVDMACGEILDTLYRTGKLDVGSIALDGAIASVSLGDATVSFDNTTTDNSGTFTALINMLKDSGRGEFACYRQFKW